MRRCTLLLIGVLLLGVLGAGATLARWYGTEPLAEDVLASGSVVLTVDGQPSVDGMSSANISDVSITPSLFSVTTEHVTFTLVNEGSTDLSYLLDEVTPANVYTGALRLRVATVTASNQCTGTAPGSEIPLTTAVLSEARFAEMRPLQAGASEILCLSLTVPQPTAPGYLVGVGTESVTFWLHSQQQVPP